MTGVIKDGVEERKSVLGNCFKEGVGLDGDIYALEFLREPLSFGSGCSAVFIYIYTPKVSLMHH